MPETPERIAVLLVEDDEDDFVLTRDLLAEQDRTRFDLEWAASYGQGLTAIEERRHDVYLIDYRLGQHTGLELVREAFASPDSAPVIMLTGQAGYEVDLEATRLGVTDFLVKGRLDAVLLERSIRYAVRHHATLAELRASEERFSTAFKDAATGMTVTSAEPETVGRFLKVNSAFCDLTGYPEHELLAKGFQDVTHPDDLGQDLQGAERMLAGELDKYQTEKRYIRADGQAVWILMTASLVRDVEGRPLHFLAQSIDITERKDAERLKEEFFALVSHELRTPLTSMIGYLELLGANGHEDDRPFLEISMRNARRLQRLVGDLLFMAQLEGGRLALQPEATDLVAVIEAAVEAARPEAQVREVSLNASLAPSLPCSGDPERLGQALDNLIWNALKYTRPEGRVDVRARREGDVAIIEVADTGLGIAREEQSRLFERFFRATTAKEHSIPGVGLGLSVTKAIVSGHNGRISVESEEGQGTRFKIELPLGKAVAPRPPSRAPAVTSST